MFNVTASPTPPQNLNRGRRRHPTQHRRGHTTTCTTTTTTTTASSALPCPALQNPSSQTVPKVPAPASARRRQAICATHGGSLFSFNPARPALHHAAAQPEMTWLVPQEQLGLGSAGLPARGWKKREEEGGGVGGWECWPEPSCCFPKPEPRE